LQHSQPIIIYKGKLPIKADWKSSKPSGEHPVGSKTVKND